MSEDVDYTVETVWEINKDDLEKKLGEAESSAMSMIDSINRKVFADLLPDQDTKKALEKLYTDDNLSKDIIEGINTKVMERIKTLVGEQSKILENAREEIIKNWSDELNKQEKRTKDLHDSAKDVRTEFKTTDEEIKRIVENAGERFKRLETVITGMENILQKATKQLPSFTKRYMPVKGQRKNISRLDLVDQLMKDLTGSLRDIKKKSEQFKEKIVEARNDFNNYSSNSSSMINNNQKTINNITPSQRFTAIDTANQSMIYGLNRTLLRVEEIQKMIGGKVPSRDIKTEHPDKEIPIPKMIEPPETRSSEVKTGDDTIASGIQKIIEDISGLDRKIDSIGERRSSKSLLTGYDSL